MNGVGIGTTDPDTVFHIKSAGPNPTIKFESTVVDEVTVLRFDNNRTTDGDIAALIQFYNEGAAPITGIRSFRGSSDTAGDLAFRTSDLERMRIDEDGNVGIGVTDPEAKLEINGQIKIISGGLGLGRVLTSDEYGLATWEATALSTDETAEHDTAKMKADTIVFVDDVDGLPIGGVGIGVLDPEQPLHIKSPSGNAFIKLESDAGVEWTMGVEGEDNFIIRDDTGDDKRFVIDSSGNIGIGVSDPDAKLEVNGQIKITGGTPGAAKVLTSDANGLATWETASSSGLAASATNQVLIDAKAYTDTSTNANLTVALAKIVVSTNANLTVAKAYTDTATNTLAGLRTTNVYYEISEKTAQTISAVTYTLMTWTSARQSNASFMDYTANTISFESLGSEEYWVNIQLVYTPADCGSVYHSVFLMTNGATIDHRYLYGESGYELYTYPSEVAEFQFIPDTNLAYNIVVYFNNKTCAIHDPDEEMFNRLSITAEKLTQ